MATECRERRGTIFNVEVAVESGPEGRLLASLAAAMGDHDLPARQGLGEVRPLGIAITLEPGGVFPKADDVVDEAARP